MKYLNEINKTLGYPRIYGNNPTCFVIKLLAPIIKKLKDRII